MGRRDVARRGSRGGERIPATSQSRRRLIPALGSVALAATVVVYAVAAGGRLREAVLATGAAGLALMLVAVVVRRPSPLPLGLALVAAAYGLYLSLHGGAVDEWAPGIAAGLFAAAELGFWSLEPTSGRAELGVRVRRVAYLAVAALFTGLAGSLLLGLTTSAGGSVALEALGVAAATATVAAIALLAARASV